METFHFGYVCLGYSLARIVILDSLLFRGLYLIRQKSVFGCIGMIGDYTDVILTIFAVANDCMESI